MFEKLEVHIPLVMPTSAYYKNQSILNGSAFKEATDLCKWKM